MENKRKKILHVVEAFGGGIFTFLWELSNSLVDEYDVVIAYSRRAQTPNNLKKYFDPRVRLIEVENFTRKIGVKDLKACKEVRALIKKENPDIIHMHSSKAGIIGRLVTKGVKGRLFYTPHGYAFLKQDDAKAKRIMYKYFEKAVALYNKDCRIIACSKGEYNESVKIKKDSTYVNNGVNLSDIDKVIQVKPTRQIDNKNIKICTVGRIGYQKNPEMFNEIAKRFPNLEFTWIGDGELKSKLTSSNINVTGWMPREDVLKKVDEADAFILPSLWEGLPISLLEAMYMKKVCLVSNVIGNRDTIKNGVNGFVCKDINEFEKILRDIIDSKIQVQDIEDKAFNDIVENYNMQRVVSCYKKIYES